MLLVPVPGSPRKTTFDVPAWPQGDSLRTKKDLIEAFIESANIAGSGDDQWKAFIDGRRERELASIIGQENLNPEVRRTLLEEALKDGYVEAAGTAIVRAMPPVSGFSPAGAHGKKKQKGLQLLADFISRYFGFVFFVPDNTVRWHCCRLGSH
jgi:type I restriction enzyme R subunit